MKKTLDFLQNEYKKIKEQENYNLVLNFLVFIIGISLCYHHLYWLALSSFILLLIFKNKIGALIFAVGFLAMKFDFARYNQTLIKKNHKNLQIEALMERSSDKERSIKYTLSNIQVLNSKLKIDGKIMAYCRTCKNLDIKPNSIISAKITTFPLPKKVYPTGYDVQNKYRFQGFSGFAFVNEIKTMKEKSSENLTTIATKIRMFFVKKLNKNAEKNNINIQTVAITEAIFFGEWSRVSSKTNDDLRKVGLSHIVTISGMHVSIIALICYAVLFRVFALSKFIRLHFNIKKISLLCALVFSFLYLMIAGMPIPGLRSFVMILFATVIFLCNAKPKLFASILFAGFCLLLLFPHELFFASFQLSFLAVLYFALIVDESWKVKNFVMRYLVSIVKSSLLITIITFPVVVYHFGGISIVGPFANIIAIPLFTFVIMPAGVCYFLLTITPFENTLICNIFEKIMFESIEGMLGGSEFISSFDYSFLALKDLPFTAVLLILIGVLVLFLIQSFLKVIGLVLAAVGIGIFIFSHTPDVVANNDSIVFREEGRYYIVGKKNDDFARAIWRSKLGIKKDFLDGEKFCDDDGICLTKKVTYLKKNAKVKKIDPIKCTDILVSHVKFAEVEELGCEYKVVVTQAALNRLPYFVLKYNEIEKP